MNLGDTVLLIPSLEPDEKLIKLVKELKEFNFENIVIINDGSNESYDPIFNELKNDYGCKLFKHFKNLGKGRALKTGFGFILNEFPNVKYVVSLDSDGQHTPKDVLKMVEQISAETEQNILVLGTREFKQKQVPFRSKFGNILTRNVMKVLCGVSVTDTQTGLRAFTRSDLIEFLDVPGERFEYELNMLLATKEKDIKIKECPIETIYLENNKSSHFRPFKDSLRIYKLFFKFIASSLISFVLDFLLFYLFVFLTKNLTYAYYIYISTVGARIISAVFNYALNKKSVFKSKNKNTVAGTKYFILAVAILILSALGTNLFVKTWHFNELLAKIIVDGTLFVLSFVIQREFIFNCKRRKSK